MTWVRRCFTKEKKNCNNSSRSVMRRSAMHFTADWMTRRKVLFTHVYCLFWSVTKLASSDIQNGHLRSEQTYLDHESFSPTDMKTPEGVKQLLELLKNNYHLKKRKLRTYITLKMDWISEIIKIRCLNACGSIDLPAE